jgi:hypothetical protein
MSGCKADELIAEFEPNKNHLIVGGFCYPLLNYVFKKT